MIKTTYKENVIPGEIATFLYNSLKDEVKWTDGVHTRNGGFTRKAYAVPPDSELMNELMPYVETAITKLGGNYTILGLYLNFYENGHMYTPNHTHPGTQQLVISLGAERKLVVGKKEYRMKNGSSIIFGSSIHGVPKEPNVRNGRISIATFMIKPEIQ